MPHGGPWVRDVWNCDLFVQFLANRGYAVLQMNYRGSVGYGQELLLKGKHEIGRGIQNDIEDATRWAIEKGIADPSRIAIVGTSYGGFSALFALGKTPDLYRCGISIAGVTDWPDIIKGMREEEYKLSYDYWVEQLGDPKDDRPFLESISPVNFADKIVAPVLIVQGKEDRVVPPKQARLMIAALEKAGRTPEKLFLPYDGHGPTSEKGRVATYTRVESFLREHLGPGVAPTMPVTEVKKK
jgi:dipeptidyl aminopeptidase/acylaminoacyl peptidase